MIEKNIQWTPWYNVPYTKLALHSRNYVTESSEIVSLWGSNFTDHAAEQTTPANRPLRVAGEGIQFDGSSDYLSVPYSTDFDFGTDDFTMDFWIKIDSSISEFGTIFSNYNSSGVGMYCRMNNSKTEINFAIRYDTFGGINIDRPEYGVWSHIAFVKTGNTISGYLNGVFNTANAFAYGEHVPETGRSIDIGANWVGASHFYGNLDSFRITKGKALWTVNFSDNLPQRNSYK